MKILLVEDEKELSNSISNYLKQEGYIIEMSNSISSAIEKIHLHEYDLILLDITLPDGNGLEILRQIKKSNQETGVLILSAKNALDDKLAGLDLGADDYLTKPFHLAELNSRINAIIRRRNFKGSSIVQFEEIKLDLNAMEVGVNSQLVELTKKEYDLLLYFIMNNNRVLTKVGIAEHLWGDHADMADNFDFIYTHIKNLRKKIESKGGNNYLKTIYGVGYKYSNS